MDERQRWPIETNMRMFSRRPAMFTTIGGGVRFPAFPNPSTTRTRSSASRAITDAILTGRVRLLVIMSSTSKTSKDKEKYNQYMNDYMKERWRKRRKEAIKYLGGKCVDCSRKTRLEFDHVDPSAKTITIARASSFSELRFWEEINKCELRCRTCHKVKTKINGEGCFSNPKIRKRCKCGKIFKSVKSYAGHKAWCRL